ncbi:hypothetical protein TrispH2_001092 [Trichoplax sp. H2]|nr:hypothetical protein TrispH2_001092 [Trichoplax sp. H2]|eukprot:RDD46829.1 hypothetical protein TrispH2_001092 [Trichoplax sp. H2]
MTDIFNLTEVQPNQNRQKLGNRRHISIAVPLIDHSESAKLPYPPKIKRTTTFPISNHRTLSPTSRSLRSPVRPTTPKRSSNIKNIYRHVSKSKNTSEDHEISSGSYQMDRQALLAQMHPDLLATLSEDSGSTRAGAESVSSFDSESIASRSSRSRLASPNFSMVSEVMDKGIDDDGLPSSSIQKSHRRSIAVPSNNIKSKQENRRVSLAFPKAANLLSSKAKGILFLQSRRASINPNRRNPSSRRTSMKPSTSNLFDISTTDGIEEPPPLSPKERPHVCTHLSLEGQYVLLKCYEDVLVNKLSKVFPGTWKELLRCRSPSLRGDETIDRNEMLCTSANHLDNMNDKRSNEYTQVEEENNELDDLFGINIIKGKKGGNSSRKNQSKPSLPLLHVPKCKLQLSLRFRTATDLLDALKLDPSEPIQCQNKLSEKWIENLVHHPLKHFSKWSNTWQTDFAFQSAPSEQLMLQNK